MSNEKQKQKAVMTYLTQRITDRKLGEEWWDKKTETWVLRFDDDSGASARVEIARRALQDFTSEQLIELLGKKKVSPAGKGVAVQVTTNGIRVVRPVRFERYKERGTAKHYCLYCFRKDCGKLFRPVILSPEETDKYDTLLDPAEESSSGHPGVESRFEGGICKECLGGVAEKVRPGLGFEIGN